jgi:hypothetical protein
MATSSSRGSSEPAYANPARSRPAAAVGSRTRHDARMDEPRTLATVRLAKQHVPTGKTKHSYGAPDGPRHPLPTPVLLRIVQYDGDSGVYLFYCDESGREMTDTWHDDVEQAMAQADFEFSVAQTDWVRS